MEIVSYGGWNRCARFVANDLELIVTLDVGPRIIRLGFVGGPNELVEYPKDMGRTGGDEYRSYGGHRLWIAPEDPVTTYEPDNEPVVVEDQGEWTLFRTASARFGRSRAFRVKLDGSSGAVALEHIVSNLSETPQKLAPWCLTVMAAGGTCIFPLPEFKVHTEALLPAAPLVLWHYTRLADPRWTWGNRVVRLRHDADLGPQKVGAFIRQGYAGYANHGNFFLKHFPAADEEYPDFGCNFETFTRHDMLEVESLGPLVTLGPGDSVSHRETWHLIRDANVPAEDDACGEWLAQFAASHPPYST
ncbi:MAG: hypothetical protein K1X67_03375 [Fimbriimonadaceae bacterium]|nr:hypothetical protein [Fimbriimonadaceae bacterium]